MNSRTPSARGAACKLQRALGIDVAIEFDRVFFVLMMHARGEVNDGVDTGERLVPVRRRADRFDHDLVVASGRRSHGAADAHPSRDSARQMPAD